MKVLLIEPPVYRFAGFPVFGFPLGLGYIAAMLSKQGHQVTIYNPNITGPLAARVQRNCSSTVMANRLYRMYSAALDNAEHEVWKEVRDVIVTNEPDVVGITCRVLDIMSAIKLAAITKSVNKTIKVVIGGAAASTCADMILADDNVDILVRREGEITMVELLKAFQIREPNLSEIHGISYKDNDGMLQHNNNRELIENISTLPYPAKDLYLGYDQYPKSLVEALMGDVITSRGCPSACTFCANHILWGTRKPRMRLSQDVVDEITHLKEKYGVTRFIFWDDNFTLNKRRATEICNLLIEKNADINWLCLVRADTIDLELLNLMKRAGCYQVQMGVESGSDRVLEKMRKGVTLSKIRKAAHLIRQSGIPWFAFFIMGFPDETEEETEATVNLLYELKPNRAALSIFAPYPGTEIFCELEKKGFMADKKWLFADTLNTDLCYSYTMSPERFRRIALRHLDIFDKYNNKMNSLFRYYAKHPILATRKTYGKLQHFVKMQITS